MYLDEFDSVVPLYVSVIEAYGWDGYIQAPESQQRILSPRCNLQLHRCPADIGAFVTGDSIEEANTSLYERYGTSYITGLDSFRRFELPAFETVFWADHVGFWHTPHRGVLSYKDGWKDDRSQWSLNAVTSTLRCCRVTAVQMQSAIWGEAVFGK